MLPAPAPQYNQNSLEMDDYSLEGKTVLVVEDFWVGKNWTECRLYKGMGLIAWHMFSKINISIFCYQVLYFFRSSRIIIQEVIRSFRPLISYSSLTLFFKFLHIYFWSHWFSVATRNFSSGGEQGPRSGAQASHGGGSSCCRTGSRLTSFSSCSAWAWLPRGLWNLPQPGTECASPALAGGFLTTGPSGKSLIIYSCPRQLAKTAVVVSAAAGWVHTKGVLL